jgi:hypothetical protein
MKNKIIDIDFEFDGVEFDETEIRRATGYIKGAEIRKLQWKTNTERKKQVSKRTSDRNKLHFKGYNLILRSPGNDLLDYYDEKNSLLGRENRAYSSIPPSVVYYYRFEHKYPKELDDPSKNYGKLAYLRDRLRHLHNTTDTTYWAQVYKTRYSWMIDKPHQKWIFDSRQKIEKFVKELTGHSSTNLNISLDGNHSDHMYWRGKLKGYSVFIEKIL